MMRKRAFALLVALLLLCAALPAAARATAPGESAQTVWAATGLLLPVPTAAQNLVYSVSDGALAQVDFTFDDAAFTLRIQKTPSFADVSDGCAGFDEAESDEEYADFQCVYTDNGAEVVAWWYDAERSASGALCCPSDAFADFQLVLYEALAGLRRGTSYAGSATYENGAFSLEYPIVQVEDAALTEKLNASLLRGVEAIASAYGPEARFEQNVMSAETLGKLFSAECGGRFVVPGAAYEDYLMFTVHVDCETGELAPLRSLLDTDALAELTYPSLAESLSSQDWDDPSVGDAQREYVNALTLEDWRALLSRADFPTEEGWPPMFTAWRDGGYFRDGNEDELPCMLLYVGVPHALQNQITLEIPFAQIDLNMTELLRVR